MKKGVLSAILIAALVAGFVGPAGAGLPAPGWMPNSPIMAGSQLIILWLPVPGGVKYNVYMNDKKVGESPSVQLILPAPEEPGEYRFQIAAVDGTGAEGAKSTPGLIRIITVEPPKNVINRVVQNKVLLRWDKSKGAVIYNVYRADKKDGEYKLAGSVQTEDFADTSAQKGKDYFYAVTAKDLAGKESKRSEPLRVSLVEQVTVADVKLEFKAVATDETGRVGFLDGKRVTGVTDIKLDRNAGEIWVVIEAKIYRLAKDGEVRGVIGPVEGVEKFIKLDFGPDGNLYLSDLRGTVYCLDKNGGIRWKVAAPKPPFERTDIWQGVAPQIKSNYGPTGGDVLCLKNEIWVSDQMFAVIYVFDYQGKFLRYIHKFVDDKGIETRFPGIGEMVRLRDGRLLLSFPMAHYASVMSPDLKEQIGIGKTGAGFIGRFIGIHGVDETPDGNLLLSDPAVNTMQVFDGKTGKYLYHIGGTTPKEDPAQPGRAFLDFGNVAFAQFLDAQSLFVYTGTEQSIVFLKLKKG